MSTIDQLASPVARGLSLLLQESDTLRDPTAQILSYRQDFDRLWGVRGAAEIPLLSTIATESTIVLVWDEIPVAGSQPSVVNLRDRVTPYDWVVAAALELARCPKPVRLLLVDLASADHSGAFACRIFPRLVTLLPWVRIYKAPRGGAHTPPGQMPRNSVFSEPGSLEDLVADLGLCPGGGLPPWFDSQGHYTADVEELLRGFWRSDLTKPGDRHDISNLIAPLLLADEMVRAGYEGAGALLDDLAKGNLQGALICFLRLLGLLERDSGQLSAAGNDSGSAQPTEPCLRRSAAHFPPGDLDLFERFADVRFLLIDDQCSLGYHDVLTTLLLGHCPPPVPVRDGLLSSPGRITLESISKPDRLLALLEKQFPDPVDWRLPRMLGIDQYGRKCFDILLLDLRLFAFSERIPPTTEELRYWDRLIALAERTGLTAEPDAQFALILRAARVRWNNGEGGDLDPVGLALLPAVLSHLDPSFPIVLFSSSHQRSVIDALHDRPNIITTFTKPLVSGYAQEESSLQGLVDALQHALRLHEMRIVWEDINACHNWGRYPTFEVRTKSGYNVYNSRGQRLTPRKVGKGSNKSHLARRDCGVSAPRQVGINLQVRLKEFYVHYLLSGRHFDFLPVPYEFLEGELRSDQVENDPNVTDFGVDFSWELDWPDNNVTSCLRHIRNRKAHGQIAVVSRTEWDRYGENGRVVILLFLVFLTYIDRTGQPGQKTEWRELMDSVNKLLLDRYFPGENRLLEVSTITSDSRIQWSHFAALAIAASCSQAADETKGTAVSPTILNAMRKLLISVQRSEAPTTLP